MKPSAERCWRAVLDRDASFDGVVVYGVLSTGVYCRPSCPSRRPLRKNVRFYADVAAAQRDDLRPCKRCYAASVRDAAADKVEQARRYIESRGKADVSLLALSEHVGLSPAHLQRKFKALVGMTPRQYAETCRFASFKDALRRGSSVGAATYDAGFGSSSRVYERADSRLGMTPGQYRHGGKGVEISFVVAQSTLGALLLATTDRGLCSVKIGDKRAELVAELEHEFPQAKIAERKAADDAALDTWMRAIRAYLAGSPFATRLPLDLRGSAFQLKVWSYLTSIPAGQVCSYAEVATAIGHPGAARAVGTACGENPVALAIPCHRVIRANGELGGYRWGLARKQALLDAEQREPGRSKEQA